MWRGRREKVADRAWIRGKPERQGHQGNCFHKLYCWSIDYPFLMHCGIDRKGHKVLHFLPLFYRTTMHQKGIINGSAKNLCPLTLPWCPLTLKHFSTYWPPMPLCTGLEMGALENFKFEPFRGKRRHISAAENCKVFILAHIFTANNQFQNKKSMEKSSVCIDL